MANDYKVLVLGGGITGLCAATLLAKHYKPQNVLLLEASDALGGTARTERLNGFTCDLGPNGYLDKEPLMRRWVMDLGLSSRIIKANTAAEHRFILMGNKLKEVKPPPGFLFSNLLSVGGRMRLLGEPFIPRRKGDEPESIWDFAARRIGPEAADTLVGPMVTGIFGGDAKALSLEHCFPKMAEMEREHGSLFKALQAIKKERATASAMGPSGVLTTFDGGLGTLCEAAATKLGAQAQCNERVVSVEVREKRYLVTTAHGARYTSDAVVMALPGYAAADACASLEKSLGAALGQIPYAGMTVMAAGFRREDIGHDLNGFGFLVPRENKVRALGCIWSSTIFPQQAPEGYVLLRVMYGGALDPDAIKLTDRQLMDQFMVDLAPVLKLARMPGFVRAYRWPKAIPQYTLDHGKRLRGIEQAEHFFKGLVFAGNAFRGVGLNDCIVSAHRAANRIMEFLPN